MLTQTDRAVIAVCGTTFLAFVIDAWLGSFWMLYLNVLITAWLFNHAIRQKDAYASELVRCIICGVAASVVYILLDWKLTAELQGNDKGRLIDYLRPDLPWLPTAPLNLLLTFLIAIIVMIYLYHRLRSISGNAFIAAGVTSVVAFIGITVFDQLGSVRLWNWNYLIVGSLPYIGSTPVFIPTAFALTFLLSPYYFYKRQTVSGYAIVSGLRCGIFMGVMPLLCFWAFRFIRI
jgi:hypothetical protein